MKRFNLLATGAMMLFGVLTLTTSCKKEIGATPPSANEPSAATASALSVTTCKPVVFGATVSYPGLPNRWVTLMQKWYGQNGKLANLKANFYTEMNNFSMLEHSIDWGAVTYPFANQVYLKNGDDLTMRVTVDEQQRAVASYYHHNHFPHGTFLIDTGYYHYTGSNLTSVERLFVDEFGGRSSFEKYNFFYDGFGNLVRIDCWSPRFNTTSMFLNYDYGKPVSDMVSLPQVTIPFKLLEYMDLLRFPVHHQLTAVTGFGNNFQFNNYVQTGVGYVSAYSAVGAPQRTFYTGWDCSGGATATEQLNSVEDFRKLFPGQE